MQSMTSRRSILRSTAAALVAAPSLRLQSKTAPEHHGAVIGHGQHRYKVDMLWSQADPAKHPVKDCHEMVQSADGRLFLLTNHPQNNVLIYNTDGKLLSSWTLKMGGAHGLTLHRDAAGKESLWICDASGKVLRTSLEGEKLQTLPSAQECGAYTAAQMYRPTEATVGPDGSIYVADGYGEQFILKFDATGKFVTKWGGRSTQPSNPGKFMQAHGIALDNRSGQPLLVVTERVRNEFNWFTLDGEHVRGVYLPGAYVSRPVIHGDELYSGVCFGARPDDFRMWQSRGFVTILNDKDQVISNPGGHAPVYAEGRLKPMLQDQPVFNNCHDVCIDTAGDLYVCQWNSGNVYPYKLRRE
jgi:peptidylamidoglycolate lyase